ncbi:2624_t:CDS:1, partial [Dentiscutata heterogama]
LDLVAPWGLVQKLVKNKFKQSLLPFVVNLQPDRHDNEENINSLIQKKLYDLEKRASRLEKLNLFYEEYVFGASLLDFVKVDSPRIYKNEGDISLILNNNENSNIDENK